MRRPKTLFATVALVTAIALGGLAGTALAQSRTGPGKDAPARLDAPEHRIDQVGPRPAGAAEKGASPPVENLDDFALGARAVPDGSLSPQTIQRLQTELYRRGYDPGPRDGVMGDATRDAIRRYQADRGWPASGTVTVRLLVALQGGDRFDAGVTSIDSSPLVLQIQDELKRRGYDVSADGRLDARTVKAIESYQSYFGMELTGEPSEDLLAHIRSGVVPLIER